MSFCRFIDGTDAMRGATSVAVRTRSPPRARREEGVPGGLTEDPVFYANFGTALRPVAAGHTLRPMQQATDPRQLAELCRRIASVPTSGGHRADRVLHALAAKLDREAAQAERPAAEPRQRKRR